MKATVFLILGFCALGANAATTKCASEDGRFQYTYSQTDGGAPIGPSWSLDIDGTTVIAHSPFGGAEIRTADLEWVGASRPHKKTTSAHYVTSYYYQDAKVTSRAQGEAILFEGTVDCQAQRYIGPPIP